MAEQFNPYAAPSPDADQGSWVPARPPGGLDATLWQRLFGALLDLALVVFTLMASSMVVGFLMSRTPVEEVPSQLQIMGPPLTLLGLLGIVQWTLIAKNGQSIGKRVVKTEVVRLDGSNPGFIHGVLLRSWIPIALTLIPIVGQMIALVDVLYVFGDDRRALHDHIAGTKVIQT